MPNNIPQLKSILTFITLFFVQLNIFSQNATVKGYIKDADEQPISNVSVFYGTQGVESDQNGFFSISIPSNTAVKITYSLLGYEKTTKTYTLKTNEVYVEKISLKANAENIKEVIIDAKRNNVDGVTGIKIETAKNIPSVNQGVEGSLSSVAMGASSNNEMSSQYKVRGGNYDENLVYVNGIEIYRPFLVRSGQQEGLSFLNPNMIEYLKFSSGGFQAKYGDKLSSVLDITYRTPEEFSLQTELSLLGASLTVEGVDKTKKTSAILGMRYRDNSLFVKSQDVQTNYDPRFIDFQTFVKRKLNNKWQVDFLGNFAINDYHYVPTARRTKFGTLQEPLELVVFYNGQEIDKFKTTFGALNFNYNSNIENNEIKHWNLDFTTSIFNTQEQEYFDIDAQYNLGNPDTDAGADDYGEPVLVSELGSQLDHARNALDALFTNVEAKGSYTVNKNVFNFGVKYQHENIKDRLIEWQVIDSAGFSIRPPEHLPNLQPYEPYEGPIVPYQYLNSSRNTDINRWMGFVQWNRKFKTSQLHEINLNVGVRSHQWQLEDYTGMVWSPRVQLTFKPNWKQYSLFRISGGNYAQPPVYKELRNYQGEIVSDVKAQQSLQIVIGNDLSIKMWGRPFTLVTEAYYKHLTDVNPYTLDNVRIRYAANNNAVAYAQGFDIRLNGEFVPGTESWFNFGYLETKENIDDQGYIARPSDQRLKFALLFQDYVHTMPNLKMYLNMVYNTGVPGGSPSYANPYEYKNQRLSDYRRADLGISYVIKDAQNEPHSLWTKHFKELSIGGEIFNMFGMENAITNTWVRDIYSKRMYGVKNYMTGRVFNVNVKMRF